MIWESQITKLKKTRVLSNVFNCFRECSETGIRDVNCAHSSIGLKDG